MTGSGPNRHRTSEEGFGGEVYPLSVTKRVSAPSVSGRDKRGTFPKPFLALSRDVDTGSCHRASDALRRCKSGTGLASGITSAAPGIILVIAALSLIHCQT